MLACKGKTQKLPRPKLCYHAKVHRKLPFCHKLRSLSQALYAKLKLSTVKLKGEAYSYQRRILGQYPAAPSSPGMSGNRKRWRQTGSWQSTPLSTIRTRYGNSVSTPEATRTCKTQQNSLQKGSRYGISVSTPHRRYGHDCGRPFCGRHFRDFYYVPSRLHITAILPEVKVHSPKVNVRSPKVNVLSPKVNVKYF